MLTSRIFATTLALWVLAEPVLADGYVMGSGRWTCAKAVETYENGSQLDKGQLAGWIMGYWSAETFQREIKFIDTVENAGGVKIAEITIAQCRQAPPDTPIFAVTQSIIKNTK